MNYTYLSYEKIILKKLNDDEKVLSYFIVFRFIQSIYIYIAIDFLPSAYISSAECISRINDIIIFSHLKS
ncbi:hypothetical protein QFZ81_003997 [Paenibacillus sp. V4I9]|nr:hypothetical protein [Paenibacillus sp. V4I9]